VKRLSDTLAKFKDRRVVVLGDFVADVFVYGETSRISREAPVLILNQRETQLVPGGGANAVHNLRALGARPIPVGIVGDDSEGRQLLECFRKMRVETSGIRVTQHYRTPSKTRILAGSVHSHQQQIVRLDSGGFHGNRSIGIDLTPLLRRYLRDAEALLVSDYGYGAVTAEAVEYARRNIAPATVDSRFSIDRFCGMTAATPNEPEVESALDTRIGNSLEKLEWAGRTLLRRLKHQALLVTRGRHGMALFEKGKPTLHIPVFGSDEIADVTGAGDTVIATFTLALSAGATFAEAARLSNYAGGIVVMKHGTRPVEFEELARAVESDRK
jgi:rfaE bifunctional protein kinase chain/domain